MTEKSSYHRASGWKDHSCFPLFLNFSFIRTLKKKSQNLCIYDLFFKEKSLHSKRNNVQHYCINSWFGLAWGAGHLIPCVRGGGGWPPSFFSALSWEFACSPVAHINFPLLSGCFWDQQHRLKLDSDTIPGSRDEQVTFSPLCWLERHLERKRASSQRPPKLSILFP